MKDSVKKTIIYFLKTGLIFVIIFLPLIGATISGMVLLKTYSVSKVIVQANYLVQKKDVKDEPFNVKAKAQELLAQTGQAIGLTKPTLKWGQPDRVNILLLGKASEDYPGSQLTDTIILASLNPQTNETAMLSIPRDLYVQIPETSQYTKLNAIYHYGTRNDGEKGGIRYISQTIEEITGQHVDYFVMLDFKGFAKMVDEIGGVRVEVKETLHDDRYPGPNYSYQTFHIEEGWHDMDGETALKYVRTRHNSGGDFGRAFRQQQVLTAIKDKFFGMESVALLPKINAILDIISENVKTDIELSEYGSFLALAKNVNTHNTVNKVLDNRGANPILVNYSPYVGRRRAYFLRPASGDYEQIKEIAQNIFDLDKLQRTYEKQQAENPKILIINRSGNHKVLTESKERLTQAGFKNLNTGGESPDLIPETTVYDNTSGLKPYSFDSLVKILSAKAAPNAYSSDSLTSEDQTVQANSAQNYNLVIVLGADAVNLLEEDTVMLPEEAFGQEEY